MSALECQAHTPDDTQPIYPNRKAARKHKPLPKKVKRAIRKRNPSAYKRIEGQLRKVKPE